MKTGRMPTWCKMLLAAILVAMITYTVHLMDKPQYRQSKITVAAGDTLWEYAEAYCPGSIDKREWIYEVERLNGIRADGLLAGMEIVVLEPSIKN